MRLGKRGNKLVDDLIRLRADLDGKNSWDIFRDRQLIMEKINECINFLMGVKPLKKKIINSIQKAFKEN